MICGNCWIQKRQTGRQQAIMWTGAGAVFTPHNVYEIWIHWKYLKSQNILHKNTDLTSIENHIWRLWVGLGGGSNPRKWAVTCPLGKTVTLQVATISVCYSSCRRLSLWAPIYAAKFSILWPQGLGPFCLLQQTLCLAHMRAEYICLERIDSNKTKTKT